MSVLCNQVPCSIMVQIERKSKQSSQAKDRQKGVPFYPPGYLHYPADLLRGRCSRAECLAELEQELAAAWPQAFLQVPQTLLAQRKEKAKEKTTLLSVIKEKLMINLSFPLASLPKCTGWTPGDPHALVKLWRTLMLPSTVKIASKHSRWCTCHFSCCETSVQLHDSTAVTSILDRLAAYWL